MLAKTGEDARSREQTASVGLGKRLLGRSARIGRAVQYPTGSPVHRLCKCQTIRLRMPETELNRHQRHRYTSRHWVVGMNSRTNRHRVLNDSLLLRTQEDACCFHHRPPAVSVPTCDCSNKLSILASYPQGIRQRESQSAAHSGCASTFLHEALPYFYPPTDALCVTSVSLYFLPRYSAAYRCQVTTPRLHTPPTNTFPHLATDCTSIVLRHPSALAAQEAMALDRAPGADALYIGGYALPALSAALSPALSPGPLRNWGQWRTCRNGIGPSPN